MNKFFEMTDTIYEIVKKYPESLDFFIANGFDKLKNKMLLETLGRTVTLDMALKTRKINEKMFVENLVSFLEKEENVDVSLMKEKEQLSGDLLIEGVLPCPIRIPLLEKVKEWVENENEKGEYTIDYNLKSANLGIGWVEEKVRSGNIDNIADILLSAGYELFFDKDLMGQYMEAGMFEAYIEDVNKDFCNEKLDLRDPKKQYFVTGVVPAIFLVNKAVLGDRKVPETWEELLSDEYKDSVALPMRDLDMFNAIVVTIYSEFGMEGIRKLSNVYKKSLHPAQMVKNRGASVEAPAISIIPYFFTHMLKGSTDMFAVWPKDGSIISPIFMICKKSKEKEAKKFIDFFMSEEVGALFSANGKFPTTNPNVNNNLEDYQNFKWVGWDFIHGNDIGKLVRECEEKFYEFLENRED